MSVTRKATRKSTTGRTTSRSSATRRTVTRTVAATPVGGEFSTSSQETLQREVPAGSILLFVNGRERGVVNVSKQKIGAFVKATAEQHGIRTFSVYADGAKLGTNVADKTFQGISKLEILAKDSRG